MVSRLLPLLLLLAAGCGSRPHAPADDTGPEALPLQDADGDGYFLGEDCDDGDPDVHPGAEETCDGHDEDCDGLVDEGLPQSDWYVDDDSDGWGLSGSVVPACGPGSHLAERGGDCDDTDATVAPDVLELACDGIDQNCDGLDGECRQLGDGVIWRGAWEGEEAGWSLAGLGDVNGDGFDDCAVGSPHWSEGAEGRGAAWILFGDPSPRSGALRDLTMVFAGEDAGAAAGLAVAAAGDFNGDGYPDLVWGAPEAGGTRLVGGAAYIAFGGPGLAPGVMGRADLWYPGTQSGGQQGSAVAGGGDVDGDGLDDVLIGAQSSDLSAPLAGAAFLFLGDRRPASGSSAVADAVFTGGLNQANAGHALAMVGDTDGDGLADMLVGAPGCDLWDRCYASLVLGAASPHDLRLDEGDVVFTGVNGTRAGAAVAGAGDVDGDGLADLLIGAPQDHVGGTLAGAAYLVLGAEELASRLVTRVEVLFYGQAGQGLGAAVAGAGDVDGDGFADVLIGAPTAETGGPRAGVAFLALGGPELLGTSHLGTDLRFAGIADHARTGAAVAGAGDLDGDGLPDLVLGAPDGGGGAPQSGLVYLLLGSELW
ncbi:MAG: MopE-related protein [Pseudomonadota bacterium]